MEVRRGSDVASTTHAGLSCACAFKGLLFFMVLFNFAPPDPKSQSPNPFSDVLYGLLGHLVVFIAFVMKLKIKSAY